MVDMCFIYFDIFFRNIFYTRCTQFIFRCSNMEICSKHFKDAFDLCGQTYVLTYKNFNSNESCRQKNCITLLYF